MVPVNAVLPPPLAALGVQVLSLVCLLANLVLVHRLAKRLSGSSLAGFVAAAATATYYPLNHWALQGMESGLQALLIAWGANVTLDFLRDERPSLWEFGAVAACSLLLRMDMAVPMLVIGMGVAFSGGLKRATAREWTGSAALVALALGGWVLFRWIYFGDLLPNTYYLKMTGVPGATRLLRGWLVFRDFLAPLVVPVGLALGLGCCAVRRAKGILVPLGVVAACFGYSVYVGGDAWEWSSVGANRFVCIAMPMLFVAGVVGADHVARWAGRTFGSLGLTWLRSGALVACGAVLIVSANGLWGTARSEERRRNWTLAELPLHVRDHAIAVRETLALSRWTRPQTRVAVGWAGIPAFFSDWELVDMHGYNDAELAKRPAFHPPSPDEPRQFKPGHVKADLEFTLVERRPDVVFQLWALERPGLEGILRRQGFEQSGAYWFRRGSSNVSAP